MANSKQATKRARQTIKNNIHNSAMRTFLRTCIKNTVKAIEAEDLESAKTAYTKLVPVLDRYANKGLLHRNKAARHKSRLNIKIKALSNTKAA